MLGIVEGREYLISRALSLGPHETFEIDAADIPHPAEMGFSWSLGTPEGQIADFRLELIDGRGIHAREYRGFFRIHWDRVHPTLARWWDHLREDAPEIALIVAIGVLLAIILAIALLARAFSRATARTT